MNDVFYRFCNWVYKKYLWDGKIDDFPSYYNIFDFVVLVLFFVSVLWWTDLLTRFVCKLVGYKFEKGD